jgi:redox-sensitive bicupin YhaK (pirin superfamily)
MIKIRRADKRGYFDHRWLQTYHTFSFGDYYDPAFMGFRSLRVINEDFVRGGRGFPTHGHRDMEIITYILAGALEHRDSMGNGSIIRPGDVQRMSAGTGVTHSEANPSREKAVHLLQIWILPAVQGLEPSYEQKVFSEDQKQGRWCLVASEDGREGSVKIHQDAGVYASVLSRDAEISHSLASGRHAWLQVARGGVTLNGNDLNQGDGAAISAEDRISLRCREDAEVLLFDLA